MSKHVTSLVFAVLLCASMTTGCAADSGLPAGVTQAEDAMPAESYLGAGELPPEEPALSQELVGQDLIGQQRDGGVVVYVFQPGDQGYEDSTTHGVIAAPEDVNTTYVDAWDGREYTGQYVWSTNVNSSSGPDAAWLPIGNTSPAIGRGASNTDSILQVYPAETYPNSASAAARAYRGGGYEDWFLPSQEELCAMYRIKQHLKGLRTDLTYWSSTEVYDEVQCSSAQIITFAEGFDLDADYQGTKNGEKPVRPARYF